MKFKFAVMLGVGLVAAGAQAAVINDRATSTAVTATSVDGSFVDIADNSSVAHVSSGAAAIDNTGLIADGVAASAEPLTVPEPENYAALAASLCMIGFLSSRRRNR